MEDKPPLIIDNAKVLEYAIVDSSIEYTGRSSLYVNGKLIGKVPKLVICQNYKAKDFLLFHCNEGWEVLGVAGYGSINETKERTEKLYKGITAKWVQIAKPNDFESWPGEPPPICSFCEKSIFEVKQMFVGNNAHICDVCIIKFQKIMEENNDEA